MQNCLKSTTFYICCACPLNTFRSFPISCFKAWFWFEELAEVDTCLPEKPLLVFVIEAFCGVSCCWLHELLLLEINLALLYLLDCCIDLVYDSTIIFYGDFCGMNISKRSVHPILSYSLYAKVFFKKSFALGVKLLLFRICVIEIVLIPLNN